MTARAPIDAALVRETPLPIGPWLLAGAADLGALLLLILRPGSTGAALAAGALHLLGLIPILINRTLTSSEKTLGASLVFALPIAGAPMAALALGTSGVSELTEAAPDDGELPERMRADEVRRLGEALPCCEALLAGSVEERRAIISTLTRRSDADAVALLRWALGAPDPDLAIEAALALEEMTSAFEARLAAHRTDFAATASSDAALAIAELVTHSIDAGIVDAALVPKLAHEARRCFGAVVQGDPTRTDAVALGRARLELAVLRPDTALAHIDGVLDTVSPEARAVLQLLREEAVLASHALPWEGPSALATYGRPLGSRGTHGPSPTATARRRYASGVRPVGGTGTGVPAPIKIGPVQVPAPAGASTQEVRRDGR